MGQVGPNGNLLRTMTLLHELQAGGQGVQGGPQRGEVRHQEAAHGRPGHQVDLGFADHRERSDFSFFHQGQVCESGTRLLLPESIHDEFVERMVERARQIKLGDTLDYETDMGPLVSAAQRETVENYVRMGKEEGAKLVIGGKRPTGDGFDKGYWYEPTLALEYVRARWLQPGVGQWLSVDPVSGELTRPPE